MFLLPGYAIVMHCTGLRVPEPYRLEIIRYLSNLQGVDGGWGIHVESISTVFGTALNYVVMRLLGVSRDDPRMEQARAWLAPRGGCLGIPSWGKFWLAVLGVYQWDGCHSLFPEMVRACVRACWVLGAGCWVLGAGEPPKPSQRFSAFLQENLKA